MSVVGGDGGGLSRGAGKCERGEGQPKITDVVDLELRFVW
jgi:hypothetical protein